MDILKINLNLLKSFLAVYKTGGIIKGAELLGMAPPAVSYNIKQLENQLEKKLFITHKKGTTPTDEAKALFPFIESAFDSLLKCNEYLNAVNKGTIRIGLSTSLATFFLVKFLQSFKKRYPNIKLEFHHHPEHDYLTMLENNHVDVAIMQFVRRPKAHINIFKLMSLSMSFFTTKQFAATHNIKNKITLEHLEHIPLVMVTKARLLANLEQTYGQKINVIEAPSTFTAYEMVMDGYGIGLHFDEYLDAQKTDQIVKLKMKGKQPPPTLIECAHNKKSSVIVSAIVTLFIKELKEFSDQLLQNR